MSTQECLQPASRLVMDRIASAISTGLSANGLTTVLAHPSRHANGRACRIRALG
jgi:hypothetical protein